MPMKKIKPKLMFFHRLSCFFGGHSFSECQIPYKQYTAKQMYSMGWVQCKHCRELRYWEN